MHVDTPAVVTPIDPRALGSREEFELRGRIRAEYVDMPGMNLTLNQASRLFGAEPVACARALDALVRDGFLACRGRTYLRSR